MVGETANFEWEYALEKAERGKRLTVTFGLWHRSDRRINTNLLVVVSDQNHKISVIDVELDKHVNRSFWKRVAWVGNLTRSHVAFQLANVTKADARDFGCKIRVAVGGPPREGFTFTALKVLVSMQ